MPDQVNFRLDDEGNEILEEIKKRYPDTKSEELWKILGRALLGQKEKEETGLANYDITVVAKELYEATSEIRWKRLADLPSDLRVRFLRELREMGSVVGTLERSSPDSIAQRKKLTTQNVKLGDLRVKRAENAQIGTHVVETLEKPVEIFVDRLVFVDRLTGEEVPKQEGDKLPKV